MNDAERQQREELQYRRAAQTYMQMQTMRMKMFYAGIYFRIIVIALVILLGLLAWKNPELVTQWWDDISGEVERWVTNL